MKNLIFVFIMALFIVKIATPQEIHRFEMRDGQLYPVTQVVENAWYQNLWEDFRETCFPRSNSTAMDIITLFAIVVLLAAFLLVMYLIALGIHFLLNFIGTEVIKGTGEIVQKNFEDEVISITTVPIIMPLVIPKEFSLYIRLLGSDLGDWMDVKKKFYKTVKAGDQISFSYRIGRLNGKLDIVSIFVKD